MCNTVIIYFPFSAKTTIDSFNPIDPTVKYGTRVKFSCTDADNEEKVTISWLKDGKPVDLSPKRIKKMPNNDLLINGTIASDTGIYTCVADNGLDSDRKNSELKVYGKNFGKCQFKE